VRFVIDMNLSPEWVAVFQGLGDEAVHWSTVGDPRAEDREVMRCARDGGYVVFTHDLDFGALLAATQADGPSVIQVRTQDVTPVHLGKALAELLRSHRGALERGALVVLDAGKRRVRILPLRVRGADED
jgi:predicted nuclease of predicted toxin-antitoxin system